MTFSRSCEYGLQAALYLAVQRKKGKDIVSLTEIAESQEIPLHYLSKILQKLVHGRLLRSMKGPGGGFSLAKKPENLTMMEVVDVIDGHQIFDRCGIGLRACSDESPCPIHHEYKIIKTKVQQVLSQKTLAELSEDVERGTAIITFKRENEEEDSLADARLGFHSNRR